MYFFSVLHSPLNWLSAKIITLFMYIVLKAYLSCDMIGFEKMIMRGGYNNLKISTRGRYSLRMMIDLAQHYNEGFIALKDISTRQNISKKYLEQIVPFLNRSNLLNANKGHMGGYQLSRQPSDITVREILECAEGSLTPVSCMDNTPNNCENFGECLTLPIYNGLYDVIVKYLDGITLLNIIDNQPDACEYYI